MTYASLDLLFAILSQNYYSVLPTTSAFIGTNADSAAFYYLYAAFTKMEMLHQ